MLLAWYLKKEWIDRAEDIEAVHVHYIHTPHDEAPDWQHPHQRWPMSGGALLKGLPRLGAHGEPPQQPEGSVRQHVLKLPLQVWDASREEWTANYLLHYFYEVFQAGRRWATDVFCDEIVYRDLEYIDWEGRLSGVCIYWSISDWDAPVWMPAEDGRFREVFGAQHERCAAHFYHFADKPRFAVEKWNLMKQLPLPWRWTARIYAPKGTVVRQRWHTGNLSRGMSWEGWDPHPPGDFVHFL